MSQSPLEKAISQKIIAEDVSFRTKMLELASGLEDVIAMGRGDPDFHTAKHIVDAAIKAIQDNEHHYTHPAGLVELREAIAEMLERDNNLCYSAEEIIVTAGAQEAIMLCMLALVDVGDEVLITSPRFTTYDTAVHMCGGKAVAVPTYEKDDFALMPSEIEARITDKTKVLVLVSPNNPTGAVTPPKIIKEIAELAKRHKLVVISDEIYDKLIYEGSEHLSIASLPAMKERTITLNGFSKSYAMTGWRIGYLAAPEAFIRMLTEARHTLSINTNTPAQFAALAALRGPQDVVTEMLKAYAERREFMMQAMDEMGLSYGHPGGAFYLYTNISNTGLSAEVFCETLLREGRVLLFPGSMFGDEIDSYVRMSYLQPLERIKEAMKRMATVIEKHRISA